MESATMSNTLTTEDFTNITDTNCQMVEVDHPDEFGHNTELEIDDADLGSEFTFDSDGLAFIDDDGEYIGEPMDWGADFDMDDFDQDDDVRQLVLSQWEQEQEDDDVDGHEIDYRRGTFDLNPNDVETSIINDCRFLAEEDEVIGIQVTVQTKDGTSYTGTLAGVEMSIR